LPQCRDPDDQKFLEAALAAKADVLITKDRAAARSHAAQEGAGSGRTVPFAILTPRGIRETV